MAKKRASIKGKGIDILFGETAAPEEPTLENERKVDIEELLGEEAELAEPELDADLEEAFGEEVMAMGPVPPTPATPVEVSAPSRAREIVSPPLEVPPSTEPRKVSVTLKVEEPSTPAVVPVPRVEEVPPTPTYPPVSPTPRVETPPPPEMPARLLEEAAYGLPPHIPEPAPAEAAPTAPPGRPLVSPYDQPPPEIKPGGYLLEHGVALGEGAGLPTGVAPREERPRAELAEERPPQISPEVSERTVLGRLGEKRLQDLFKEIDALVMEAAQVLSVDEEGLEKALSLLREARDITIERPRQFDEAEYRVAKVRAMLERRKISGRWSVVYGYPVLIYEVVWFLLLLGSLLFDHSLAVFIANLTEVTFSDMASLSMEHIFPYWNTMAWGGIGGVVGSLYSLYWHAAYVKDFDRQYVMNYIVQPIMGIILGGIVYLLFAGGLTSIQVLAGQATGVSEAAQTMANPTIKAFHSVVAVVAGFRNRFVYEMLDRVVQALTPAPKTKAEREAEEKEKEEETG
jgi:hypothetical protein